MSAYENYHFVLQTIEELQNPTMYYDSAWHEKHKNFILKIRKHFTDLSEVNLSIEEENFRNAAKCSEIILNRLESDLDFYDKIDKKLYLQFCYYIQTLATIVDDEENFADLFSGLSCNE